MNSKKRDLIKEIVAVKSRTEFNSRFDYKTRFQEIEDAIVELKEYTGLHNKELLKYIPIATVACYQSFFSSTIKEIIDFGKPYSDNISAFNQSKNVKLDFDVVAAIQTKTLTVGEFVAHVLPCNNLDDINNNITTLIGKTFLDELQSFKITSIYEHVQEANSLFLQQKSQVIKSVKETFELRHIFCHESATNVDFDTELIVSNFLNCKLFLEQANNYIWELLYPNSPETNSGMRREAGEQLANYEEQLNALIIEIKKNAAAENGAMDFDQNLFDDCIVKWKEYRKLHAEYVASPVKGGNLFSVLHATDMVNITKEKIASLENEFAVLLRKNKKQNFK